MSSNPNANNAAPNIPPNILVVMADQLSALALRSYGNPTCITPHIDQLAQEGVVFENCYSSSPLCTPARYAMMTGQNISRCGGFDNAAYMPATQPTFAHYLRRMGYHTALAGKMHFVGPDQLHGFETRLTTDIYPADFGWVPDWNTPDERIDLWYHNMSSVKQAGVAAISNQLGYDDEVGSQSLRAIYDHARSTDPRPLCLVASFMHPHDPYVCRQAYWDRYDGVDIPMPEVPRPSREENDLHSLRLEKVIALDAVDLSDDEIRTARRAYYANISYVDDWLGRLRATLDECGLLENTTIIFTSDHGDMLGERGLWYKMTFFEWSSRIPLIIWQPSMHQSGKRQPQRVDAPVAQVDLLPTLVELAQSGGGIAQPDWIDPIDGESLVDACNGDAAKLRQRLCVSEYTGEGSRAPMLMLRDERYKFITAAGDDDQLFDLSADPNELNNLAALAAYADTLAHFREQAAAHWNVDEVTQRVLADQHRRREVHAALELGQRTHWDYNPPRDASLEYSRSHLELTEFDFESRFPRPPAFKPRWR